VNHGSNCDVIPREMLCGHRNRIVLRRVLLECVRLTSEIERGTFEVLPHTFRKNVLFWFAVSAVYDSATSTDVDGIGSFTNIIWLMLTHV